MYSVYVCTYVHACIYVYVSMHTCMYVFMCIYIYMYIIQAFVFVRCSSVAYWRIAEITILHMQYIYGILFQHFPRTSFPKNELDLLSGTYLISDMHSKLIQRQGRRLGGPLPKYVRCYLIMWTIYIFCCLAVFHCEISTQSMVKQCLWQDEPWKTFTRWYWNSLTKQGQEM